MRNLDSQRLYSASGLVHFLACRHHTYLDLETPLPTSEGDPEGRCCRNTSGGCLLTYGDAKTRIHLPLQDTNWHAYNLALVRLGQLTLWFDEAAVAAWRDTAGSSGPGRPKVYANAAIKCALVLKSIFHLSLRATQGFLESVVTLMGLELLVPDYSTMSRRQAGLEVNLRLRTYAGTRHIVVDSTGLKVYGAGEWHAG